MTYSAEMSDFISNDIKKFPRLKSRQEFTPCSKSKGIIIPAFTSQSTKILFFIKVFFESGTEKNNTVFTAGFQVLKELAFEMIYFDGKKVSRLSPPVPDKNNPKIHKWYLGAEYSF